MGGRFELRAVLCRVLAAGIAAVLLSVSVRGQSVQATQTAAPSASSAASAAPAVAPVGDDARAKAAEFHRMRLQDEVDRMVRMAESLKATVEITKKDELSVEVIREADRIEQLAKNMKESARK